MNIDTSPNITSRNRPAKQQGVAISVRGLSKSFDGAPVLRGLSFEIAPGEIFVIMGPSGAGKTVLLNHLIGLLEPDHGEVRINGMSPTSRNLHDKIRMAMVFQNSGLLNSLSVEENVSLYLTEHRLKPWQQIRQIVREQLEHLNLSRADAAKYPFELSGGMRKRVAIARAIVTHPAVLLADEPTGNLDTKTSQEIMELITAFNREKGITVLMVTHEPDMAAYARRIIRFVDGHLESDSRKEEAA